MQITYTDGRAVVDAPGYRWEWARESDLATLSDRAGRRIATYPLQPVIELHGAVPSVGHCDAVDAGADRLDIGYSGVNGEAEMALSLTFADRYFTAELSRYDGAGQLVAAHFAALGSEGGPRSAGNATHTFVPGGGQDPEQHLFSTVGIPSGQFSLGASRPTSSFHQQPFLPSYLFAFYSEDAGSIYRVGLPAARSGAACMGLTGVPAGNPVLNIESSRFSAAITYRGDLWGTGPEAAVGTRWLIAVGEDWYSATREYVRGLVAEGHAQRRTPADVPASAFWPEYDTWGDQIARAKVGNALDQAALEEMYGDLRASGLQAKLFVIDDLWETAPGSLTHCPRRFAHFDEFREQLSRDGMELGLWTAFPRCGDFRDYGLDESAVLRTADGKPYFHANDFYGTGGWYIFDPTDPRVQRHFRERATELVRRYRPKLVKIDFGYEIPTLDTVAPHDIACAGDRLFEKFLDVIVGALKAADPEITVQYYSLTPLLARHWDHLSLDDMWMSRGNFHDAFGKRAVVASIAGELGLPVYGSTGYDWASVPEIWLDSPVLGTIGAMAPFAGDISGERPTPGLIAKYNGLTRLTRTNGRYDVEFLDRDANARLHNPLLGPSAGSWARREEQGVTVVALRPAPDSAEYPGIVRTTAPAVVASLDENGLDSARRLGIVPFGDGECTFVRQNGPTTATAHLFGGATRPVPLRVEEKSVTLRITEECGSTPVELFVIETSL
ncbi:MAG TPA: hypothetical protein VHX59_00850 [Mycobacteriales bacterium]|nr:hypothetical protein [Mycobacteriales bacterium]